MRDRPTHVRPTGRTRAPAGTFTPSWNREFLCPGWPLRDLSTSPQRKTPEPTLNAIVQRHALETDPAHETAEDLRLRHLRTCQELIELGMDLAREASHQSMNDMHARPPGSPMPGSAAAEIERANARARLRGPNHALIFTRLSQSVRQTMALQAHIAAGTTRLGTAPASRDPALHDPALHDRALHDPALRPRPACPDTGFRTENCDWALPACPDGVVPVQAMLHTIRQHLTEIASTASLAEQPGQEPDDPDAAPLTWSRLEQLLPPASRDTCLRIAKTLAGNTS